jgi:flagellar biosynthetic protein FliO
MESQGQIAAPLPGLGGAIGVALLSLGLVCVLAYAVLRFLSRRGFGHASGPIRILARCALEPRRSLYLIEVSGRRLLVGAGDGPMTTLADLGTEAPGSTTAPAGTAVLSEPAVTTAAAGEGSEGLGGERVQVGGAPGPAQTPGPAPARFSEILERVRGQRSGAGAP